MMIASHRKRKTLSNDVSTIMQNVIELGEGGKLVIVLLLYKLGTTHSFKDHHTAQFRLKFTFYFKKR